MEQNNKPACCQFEDPAKQDNKKKGLFWGIVYGVIPHSFCILFIVLSVIGAAAGAAFMRKFLLIPYFFHLLIGISLFFATISAALYLRRCGNLSWDGIKKSWKYLSVLYGVTLGVGALFFLVIFPYAANLDLGKGAEQASASDAVLNIAVDIPCSGHAPLITGELKEIKGVKSIKFKLPSVFEISYDKEKTGIEEILALEIFKTYKASVKN